MIDATEQKIAGAAGALHVRAWRASSPKALVAICPGFNSHSGYYEWFGARCVEAGYSAYAVDLRGRGKSDGERFYIETFDDYVADVHALVEFAKSAAPGVPLFLLGHSAGGVTACLYALQHRSELAGLICEDFAFEVPAPNFALQVLKGLSHVVPHAPSLKLHNEDFSRDPRVVAAMNADPLIADEAQPFATAAAIVRADERLKRAFGEIKTPVLILHGDADKAAKVSGSEHFYAQAGAQDKTLRILSGRYHDPLNDLEREEVAAMILEWIAGRAR